jgi:MerC mercury resistance protein
MKEAGSWFDRGAIGVSILCMVHCLALPVLVVLFPFGIFAVLAENHWHWLFLALAAPISLLAFLRTSPHIRSPVFAVGMVLGIVLLAIGVWVDDHDQQIFFTVLGAISLLAAHVYNLRRLSAQTE